jgi:hypothetical protein
MKQKIEIIDNQISNFYLLNLYSWKKAHWWSSESWILVYGHSLGHKYKLPTWHKDRKKSSKELFEEEVKRIVEKYKDIQEIHRVIITNN